MNDVDAEDRALTVKNVSNVLTGITDSYTLGLQLDLPSSNLATLASDHPTSLRRMQETVSSWLHYDTEASWSRLARAVEVMGYRDIAETIRRDYCDDSVDGGTASNPGAHSTATAGVSNGRTRSSQTPRITERPDLLLLYAFPGRQRSFSIAKEVGDNYRRFGVFLLKDGNAAVVKSLAVKCNNDPERINEEILDRWVTGQGGELSWGNLVRVLNTIGLKSLAKEVEEVTGP